MAISKPKRIEFDLENYATRSKGELKNQTILLNTLSTFFPEGERLFVNSVRHFAKRPNEAMTIEKIKLHDDISRFCGQEAHHAQAHDKVNAKLYKDGYKNVEPIVKFFLSGLYKYFPKLALHTTTILEHYTSTLAKQVLDGEYVFEDSQWTLWRQHAIEEHEHRKVSFQLLSLVGSTTFSKLLFPIVSLVFAITIGVTYVLNGGRWDTKLFKSLGKNIPKLFSYSLPGFRP